MNIARRISEDLGDSSDVGEADVRDHLKNTVRMIGGGALLLADAALAYKAVSWEADVLAVPGGIWAYNIFTSGGSGVIKMMTGKSDENGN